MRITIPDYLSVARGVLCPFLLVLEPLSVPYLVLYLLCCLLDVMDGFLARRLGQCTPHGQILDSACDIILALCLLVSLIPVIRWESWFVLWVVVIVIIRISAFVIGTRRGGSPALIHTYANKAAGLALAVCVFLLPIIDFDIVAVSVLLIASVAAAEYFWICTVGDVTDRDAVSALK